MAATVFSWDLRINGQSVTEPFGGLKFSGTVPGFGVSGIATTQFGFDIFDEHGIYGQQSLQGATAELAGVMGKFYISKRSVSKGVVHFIAYDLTTDLSGEFDPSEIWQSAAADYVTVGSVLNTLSSQSGVNCSVSGGDVLDIKVTREQLTGQSFNGILEMISETAAGVWISSGENALQLICLEKGDSAYGFGASCSDFADIDYCGIQTIGKLIHTNSETGNVEENGGTTGNVISVENPIVARGDGLCGKVWERIGNYQYQAWRCEKALLESVPSKRLLCTAINFEGKSPLIVGDFTLDIDSTGIYFSGGRDPQSEERWEYKNKIERTKIGVDKWVGSSVIQSNGMRRYRNENLDDYPDDF